MVRVRVMVRRTLTVGTRASNKALISLCAMTSLSSVYMGHIPFNFIAGFGSLVLISCRAFFMSSGVGLASFWSQCICNCNFEFPCQMLSDCITRAKHAWCWRRREAAERQHSQTHYVLKRDQNLILLVPIFFRFFAIKSVSKTLDI